LRHFCNKPADAGFFVTEEYGQDRQTDNPYS